MTDTIPEDIWIMLMASYWRLTSAIERRVREETADLPDWIAQDTAKEIRETAYPEERRIWGAGVERLLEIYGVPDAPDNAAFAQGALFEIEAPRPQVAKTWSKSKKVMA
jgi:hypothetical protein